MSNYFSNLMYQPTNSTTESSVDLKEKRFLKRSIFSLNFVMAFHTFHHVFTSNVPLFDNWENVLSTPSKLKYIGAFHDKYGISQNS